MDEHAKTLILPADDGFCRGAYFLLAGRGGIRREPKPKSPPTPAQKTKSRHAQVEAVADNEAE